MFVTFTLHHGAAAAPMHCIACCCCMFGKSTEDLTKRLPRDTFDAIHHVNSGVVCMTKFQLLKF